MIAKARATLAAGVLALGMAGLLGGCSSGKAQSCQDFDNTIHDSVSKMTAAQNDPASFESSAADVVKQLRNKAAAVSDSKVKTALSSFADDLDTFVAAFQRLQQGDSTAQAAIQAVAPKIEADGATLDKVCK